jgi:hypothetical protein
MTVTGMLPDSINSLTVPQEDSTVVNRQETHNITASPALDLIASLENSLRAQEKLLEDWRVGPTRSTTSARREESETAINRMQDISEAIKSIWEALLRRATSEIFEDDMQGSFITRPPTASIAGDESDTSSSRLLGMSVEAVEREIAALFRRAASEEFEDGMESDFITRLLAMVRIYEATAMLSIQDLILGGKATDEASAEALRWLGDMEHEPTYQYRRWLLEKALLSCSSLIVRDGANLGLAFMDDPHAIPALEKAIESTRHEGFRRVLLQTLTQLESTAKWRAS